jgi:hypothetical protein
MRRMSRCARALVTAEVVGVSVVMIVLVTRSSTPTDAGAVPLAGDDASVAQQVAPLLPHLAVDPPLARPLPLVADPRPEARGPRRLLVASLGIDATVEPVGVSANGALAVPEDVNRLGWWKGGAAPGSLSGTVVIDGHVDSKRQGKGQLFPLERARPGDRISMETASGLLSYRVVARRIYGKANLPSDLFAVTGRHRLVLITCGGPFDRSTGHYDDNVVVYAVPEPDSVPAQVQPETGRHISGDAN